jgi:hypothetical protein
VDADDRGVVDAGRRARLAFEPGAERGIGGELGVHHLDGDGTVEPDVGAAVHSGHSAAREHGPHLIARVQQRGGRGVHG